jgi:hypothetical protein
MDKILKTLQVRAENGDENANAVFREIDGMDKNQLADYVYTHDAQLRKILGVKNLVEKEGNPEFTKEYFDLLNQGRAMNNRDKYTKYDYNNQKLKDVPYYMEKFGLPKENGEYSLEDQIKFANSVSNLDSEELANLAWMEGFEGDADQMRNEIKRTGERLIGDIARKGRNPETGSSFYWKYPLHVAKALAAPRITEAYESGQEPDIKDVLGDEAEMALNFIPGTSAASKGARWLSTKFNRLKNLPKNALARVAGGAAEMGATPLGSQLYDMAAYDNSDPRGQWDTERVVGQTIGNIGGLATVKGIGAQGKNLLEGTSGKTSATDAAKSLMNVVENIGNDAKENIARRQLVMERKAEMARDPRYNDQITLTGKQNQTGVFSSPEDLVDYEDFMIRKSDAERFHNIQNDLDVFDANVAKANELLKGAYGEYDPNTNIISSTLSNGETIPIAKVPLEKYKEMTQGEIAQLTVKALRKAHPELNPDMAAVKRVNDYGDNDIVFQLPDGRFIKGETIKKGYNGKIYVDLFDDGLDAGYETPNLTLLENNGEVTYPTQPPIKVKRTNESESVLSFKPRDPTVRRELAKDPDFDAIASGRAEKQPLYNTAAYAGFNAAAREGIVGEGLGLDDKRESALWNNQLKQLRPLVQIDGTSPEYKRQMVDAIMNVMTYGEDLPEEMYKQNRNAYDAIAQRLGISYNNSFKEVADYPTTSYSSAR